MTYYRVEVRHPGVKWTSITGFAVTDGHIVWQFSERLTVGEAVTRRNRLARERPDLAFKTVKLGT